MDIQTPGPVQPVPTEASGIPNAILPTPKPSAPRWLWIGLAVAVVLAGASYTWMKFIPASPAVSPSPSTSATSDETSGWKTYTSQRVNISFKYPGDWTVKEWNNYSGSAQGNDELQITKGSESIYTSTKRDCLEGATYCKTVYDAQYPQGWPSFSTLSTHSEVWKIIDRIVSSAVHPR